METNRFACLLLPLLGLAGCGGDNPYFSDDEGGARGSGSIFSDHGDELSLPYALGTRVRIALKGREGSAIAAWKIDSDNSAVLSVDKLAVEGQTLVADCTARAEGAARVRLVDDGGKEVRRAEVTVRAPDRARLLSHAELRILGRSASSFDSAFVTDARILDGGTGVYGIVYDAGGTRVYGRGIIAVDALTGIETRNETTSGVATNEWLFVTPRAVGSYPLGLRHGQRMLGTFPVSAVAEAAIAGLALGEENAADRKDGDEVWLHAEARDAAGRSVDGVYCDWTLDGVQQVGKDNDTRKTTGDLFRYVLSSKAAPREAVARRGAHRASRSINAEKAWVSDTTYLGCSVAGGRSGHGALAFAFLIAAVLIRALRRRSVAR